MTKETRIPVCGSKSVANLARRESAQIGFGEFGVWPWIALTTLMVLTAIQLQMQGRQWWCACGQPFLWSCDIWSRHNSQHLFDPYSFTHVLHGMVFCGVLAWLCSRVPPAWRLFLATVAEAL